MTLFRPVPRRISRSVSLLVLCAWVATMAIVVHRAFAEAGGGSLATDLARYGTAAQWRGVYYRNEKIGFTVSQTIATDDGFELQEDGRLQMSLLGARNVVSIRTTARVGHDFGLRSFDFSLDPGTGGTRVRGELQDRRLHLIVSTAAEINAASVALSVSQVSGAAGAGAAATGCGCASAQLTAAGVITAATAVPAALAPFRNCRRGIWSSAMTPSSGCAAPGLAPKRVYFC